MHFEFAIDPASINRWEPFRYVFDNCGYEHGRLISRFPKKWKKMVYEACEDCGEIEKKKIEERLVNIDGKFYKNSRDYDSSKDWLINAELKHGIIPFRAIISSDNPRNIDDILLIGDLHSETHNWKIDKDITIERTPNDLAKCAEALLSQSEEIVFVDPYYGPENERYRRTLEKYLQIVKRNCKNIRRIEYHLQCVDGGATKDFFISESKKRLQRIVPDKLRIHFIRWRQLVQGDHLHPRYILTDKGGLRYESGLDQGEDGETTDVSLLDSEVYKRRWEEYRRDSNVFEFVDEFVYPDDI
jgi:hypothetical protein